MSSVVVTASVVVIASVVARSSVVVTAYVVVMSSVVIIEYVWSTALSTIFKLYLCGHVYRWRKLEFSEKPTIYI
jgi:hypothetical protein